MGSTIPYTSGIGPQAGRFNRHKRAVGSYGQGRGENTLLRVTGGFKDPQITAREAGPARWKRQIRRRGSRSRPESRAEPRASGRQTDRPGCRDRTRVAPEVAAVPAARRATIRVVAAARAA